MHYNAIAGLMAISDFLDARGMFKRANKIDVLIKKMQRTYHMVGG